MDLDPISPEPQYGSPGTGPGMDRPYAPPPAPPYQPFNPGYQGAPTSAAQANVTNVHLGGYRPFNHTLHLILTLITCGMWAPIWIIMYMLHQKH